MMNQREKLIELLNEFYYQDVPPCSGCQHEMSAENPECEKCIIEHEADYLIDHGVIVLSCRCGECTHRRQADGWCGVKADFVGCNGYCNYAERR